MQSLELVFQYFFTAGAGAGLGLALTIGGAIVIYRLLGSKLQKGKRGASR